MNKLVIELGGKQRTLKFNMLFLEEYQKKAKEGASNVTNTALVIWSAIKANADITETSMDCTLEDCFDWAEEMMLNNEMDKANKILSAYMESTIYKSIEAAKKKMD